MPTPPTILNKVKLLLKLSGSPNPHEADSARKLAEGLIKKHNITPEELESIKDPKPLYGEEEKLYSSTGIIGWKRQLALCIGTHFDCQIVQEELVPYEGEHQFDYYVYGDVNDVANTQLSFHTFVKQVEQLVSTRCLLKGPIYIASYCEGIADSIKQNILAHGIELPEKQQIKSEDNPQAITPKSEELTKIKEDKPKPAERSVDVNSQSLVQDIGAYFNGIYDGRELFLKDILELEDET